MNSIEVDKDISCGTVSYQCTRCDSIYDYRETAELCCTDEDCNTKVESAL